MWTLRPSAGGNLATYWQHRSESSAESDGAAGRADLAGAELRDLERGAAAAHNPRSANQRVNALCALRSNTSFCRDSGGLWLTTLTTLTS